MKVTTTTLPRSSLSESRRPSWVVRVNSGAGPIFDSRSPSSALWLSPGARQPIASRTISMPRYQPCLVRHSKSPLSSRLLSLSCRRGSSSLSCWKSSHFPLSRWERVGVRAVAPTPSAPSSAH